MINIRTRLRSHKAALKFSEQIQNLGGKVIGEYKKNTQPVECECSKGHKCNPRPSCIQSGQGMCLICGGKDPKTSNLTFIDKIEELGGKVIGEYKKSNIPVECRCIEGHICNPTPSNILQGNGMCLICVKKHPITSRDEFIKCVEELGGRVIGSYKTSKIPVECICEQGHICHPSPTNLKSGWGFCGQCSQSRGEIMVYQACKKLDIPTLYQPINSIIPILRFDYSCIIKNKLCYIEFDGIQHFEYTPLFHKTEEGFTQHRERDLLKAYVCKINDIKLIHLDHTWISRSIEEMASYLQLAFYNDKQLIADGKLYDWIKGIPSDDTKIKYMI